MSHPVHHDHPHHAEAARRRDRGLRRVGRTTRRVALLSVAGAMALGAGYAHALPKLPNMSTVWSVFSLQSDWHPVPPAVHAQTAPAQHTASLSPTATRSS
ncbi:hypothetical protein NGB36_15830 [Streptomyces sp. RB6PN25]|uniref:Uncharacterized protein n=1 Tax=Streptomyces humicola TaxID=2953240 RepID=A0ABT1PWI0_9ACTN|nr:hypothetical protein [Streptomyces humicola]MCQ4082036.1 hypothetical protein [Streptomyces humicola]